MRPVWASFATYQNCPQNPQNTAMVALSDAIREFQAMLSRSEICHQINVDGQAPRSIGTRITRMLAR